MLATVGGIGRARIRQIGRELHLQVNDLDPRSAGRSQNLPGRIDDCLDRVDGDSCAIEHPTSRREIVLHVDDDHRR